MHLQTDRSLAANLPVFKIEKFVADHANKAKHHLSASDAESLSVSQLLELDGATALDAFETLKLGYSDIRGTERLRAAIAGTYTSQRTDSIMCFSGAGEAIFALFNVLFDADDHAITVEPNYQSHEALPGALGSVTCVPLEPQLNWALNPDRVAAAIRPNTKAIILNFPHNPTGTILSESDLTALVSISRDHGLYLINDEVFSGLGPSATVHPPTVADIYEKGISINVMSKAYGLPGLRVGWIATPDTALFERVELFKHYLNVCLSTPSEFLAEIALRHRDKIFARNGGLIDQNIALWADVFSAHQDVFVPAYPNGGCIAYPEYIGPGSVDAFAAHLLNAHGVFVVPASVFSSDRPTQHFRIGFGRDGLSNALDSFDYAVKTFQKQ